MILWIYLIKLLSYGQSHGRLVGPTFIGIKFERIARRVRGVHLKLLEFLIWCVPLWVPHSEILLARDSVSKLPLTKWKIIGELKGSI